MANSPRIVSAQPILGNNILGSSLLLPDPSALMAAAGGAAVVYTLRVDFTTPDASPLTNPYVGEVGSLVPVEVDGTLAVASDLLTNTAQATPIDGDLGVRASAGIARVAGRVLLVRVTPTTLNTYPIIIWSTTAAINGVSEAAVRIESAIGVNDGGYIATGGAFVVSTQYDTALVLHATGASLFIKGGIFTNWFRKWVFRTGVTATLYPAISYFNGVANVDHIRVRDLIASFGAPVIDVSSFGQSFGSELFLNNLFANWTGGNPNSWTVLGESGANPEVSEVAPGNLHGGGGTGAANLFSTANPIGLSQNVATVGAIYEMLDEVTAFGSGSLTVYFGGSDPAAYTLASVGARKLMGRSLTGTSVYPAYSGGAVDITVDNVSLKRITLNTALVMPADSLLDYTFVLPGSPVAGQEIHLLYRIEAPGDELLDCWDAYLRRNDANSAWDFRLDSIAAGTKTNRINTTGVGNVTTIRVICSGNNHDCFTLVGTTWTKRGGTINNSSFATATGLNTIASSGFTESNLRAYEITPSNYAELDRG